MSKFWVNFFSLNHELSIWVEEEELGKEKIINHKSKSYYVTIPQKIDKKITLRLNGLGKTRFHKTGDLLLNLFLNKGENVRKFIWLSETSARNGANKNLFIGGKIITVVIPPNSFDGLSIRLRGLGEPPSSSQHSPVLDHKKNGDLLVKLCVFPDRITPSYGTFDALSTENMALEGWIYRKFDEVLRKLDRSNLPTHPIQADTICDLFNEKGWASIFDLFVDHLKLTHLTITYNTSATLSLPGSCERTTVVDKNSSITNKYRITINDQFLQNPFSVAAILAHELSHIVYSERFDETTKKVGYVLKSEKANLEEERTVDLLAFVYKIGEFQLRVARDMRLTFGYFDQKIFERMFVIVSRKISPI